MARPRLVTPRHANSDGQPQSVRLDDHLDTVYLTMDGASN
jgi:hypothetical protein